MSSDGTQREVVPTAHGNVEYETVTCASCDNTVAKEHAKRFVIGEIREVVHWSALGKREYEFETSDYQEGWACEYCRNDSIVDFPLKSVTNPTVVKLVLVSVSVAFFGGLLTGGAL